MEKESKKTEKEITGRSRSPSYPVISLPKAIERVKALYENARHHKVGVNVLADSWNYSLKSSKFMQTTAALLQFGLLEDEGGGDKRRFQLTTDALRIVQDADPLSVKRKEAIARAALKPKMHKELWTRFGTSIEDIADTVLQNYLILDRNEGLEKWEAVFSETAASSLISEYKETIAFAQISEETEITHQEKSVGGEIENKDSEQGVKIAPTPVPSSLHQSPLGHSAFKITQNERVVFTEEVSPQQNLRLVVVGDLNEYLLETLEDFVKRQRKRLQLIKETEENRPVDSQTNADDGNGSDEEQDTAEDPFFSEEGE